MKITAKVAAVLNDYQLAINAGSARGVVNGAEVTLSRRVQVKDPDTGEALGSVTYPRATFAVILVNEKFCVAKVEDRTPGATGAAALLATSSLFGPVLKKVTDLPGKAQGSDNWILVTVGEIATIEIPGDEPAKSIGSTSRNRTTATRAPSRKQSSRKDVDGRGS